MRCFRNVDVIIFRLGSLHAELLNFFAGGRTARAGAGKSAG